MATKRKNTLPTPAHVQAIVDALEKIKPAHWTAGHGKGSASTEWMIYSKVFLGRMDDAAQAGEIGCNDYRVGVLVTQNQDDQTCISFFLFGNQFASRRFKANFRPELLHLLNSYAGEHNVICACRRQKQGKKQGENHERIGQPGAWIQKWLNDPLYYIEDDVEKERVFMLSIGIVHFNSPDLATVWAPTLAAAYMPLLECMVPLEGEPIDPNREKRSAQLRAKLTKVTGPAKQCSCEHRKIDGLDSLDACGGPLEAAHIKPYQQGGSDDPSNGLWLCRVHHCETEGRIAGNRLSVRLLDHIPQRRFSRLATAATA